MPQIEVKNLTKKIGDKTLLDNVSFRVDSNKLLCIVGPSGAGKTTLLNIIAGLDNNYDGDVLFDGIPVNDKSPMERNVGMIFQEAGLFPHTKVGKNITYGMHKLGYKENEINEKLDAISKKMKINDLLNRYPASLSAGEKQSKNLTDSRWRFCNGF